jgi:hypothetical protein
MADVPGINLAPGYGIPLAVVPWSSDIRKEPLRPDSANRAVS